ncbi:MAG: type II secretion system protein [Pseudomonadota bacterium]
MLAPRRDGGFTYLALLFFVAAMGATLAATGLLWSTAQQRVKEQELLFIGNAFRQAIGDYYERTPGALKRYPPSLDALLKDDRQAGTVRHLRRIYADPFTHQSKWGEIKSSDGGVKGVYSLSDETPIRKVGVALRASEGAAEVRYSDWQFIYEPVTQTGR